MNVGLPTSKFQPIFRIRKVAVPVLSPALAIGRRRRALFQLPQERLRGQELDVAPHDARGEPAIGGHDGPSPPLARAIDDQIIGRSLTAEGYGDRSEAAGEGGWLEAVEDAGDAGLPGTRESRQKSHETALLRITVTVGAHDPEKVAAIDQVRHRVDGERIASGLATKGFVVAEVGRLERVNLLEELVFDWCKSGGLLPISPPGGRV